MIRTVQTTVIYCFKTRDEKAYMLIVVFEHRQRLQDLALHGPRTIVTEENSDFVYCRYNEHYEQVEKTPNENY